MKRAVTSMIATLSLRERRRDDYRQQRDPIRQDQLLWWKQDLGHAYTFVIDRAGGAVETAVAISFTTSCLAAGTRGDY